MLMLGAAPAVSVVLAGPPQVAFAVCRYGYQAGHVTAAARQLPVRHPLQMQAHRLRARCRRWKKLLLTRPQVPLSTPDAQLLDAQLTVVARLLAAAASAAATAHPAAPRRADACLCQT